MDATELVPPGVNGLEASSLWAVGISSLVALNWVHELLAEAKGLLSVLIEQHSVLTVEHMSSLGRFELGLVLFGSEGQETLDVDVHYSSVNQQLVGVVTVLWQSIVALTPDSVASLQIVVNYIQISQYLFLSLGGLSKCLIQNSSLAFGKSEGVIKGAEDGLEVGLDF